MSKKRKQKSLPVQSTVVETPKVEVKTDEKPYRDTRGKTTLFCYGTLNVHEIQRMIWGEAMEGQDVVLADYELKLWPNSMIMYVEKRIGEKTVGKAYELTDEQLKATDKFESDAYKRITIRAVGKSPFDVYVRNPDTPSDTAVVLK